MEDMLAFDRAGGTVRLHDADTGRLHVSETPISKAGVNPYRGSEIPGWQRLGLDANKIYNMLRPADELEKAAATFQRVPIMTLHPKAAFDAKGHKQYKTQVAGATGSTIAYKHPYLTADLAVWDFDDIEGIAKDSVRELSSSYYYTPDMTPGTYEGVSYDGRMTNIRGHHVALVPVGRAGRDVLVADSGENVVTKKNPAEALFEKLTPMLAQDADLEAVKAAVDEATVTAYRAGRRSEPVAAMDAQEVREAIDAAVAKSEADHAASIAAMDAARDEAIRVAKDEATAEAVKRMNDKAQAEKDVRPLVGEVVGMDSADEIYAHALKNQGVEIEGVHPSAFKAMVKLAADRKAAAPVAKAAAMDSGEQKTYKERFKSPYLTNTGV